MWYVRKFYLIKNKIMSEDAHSNPNTKAFKVLICMRPLKMQRLMQAFNFYCNYLYIALAPVEFST